MRTKTGRFETSWYRAFDVKPGEKLTVAPQDRVRIW
jgi:putative endopeptidase